MSSTIAGELVYKIVGDTSKFDTVLKDSHNIVNQFVRSRTLVQLGNQLSGLGREFDKLKTNSKSSLIQMTSATNMWVENHVTALNQGISANSDYIDSVNSIGDAWGSAVAQGDGFFTMLTQTSGLLSEMRGEVHTLKEDLEGLSTVKMPSGGGGVAQPVVQNDPVADVLGMTASGVSIGAAFGGPVGAAIGGGVGLVVGGLKELYDYSKDKTPINYAEELSDSYSNLKQSISDYRDIVKLLKDDTGDLTDMQRDQLTVQKDLYESKMLNGMRKASNAYDEVKDNLGNTKKGIDALNEISDLFVGAEGSIKFRVDLPKETVEDGIARVSKTGEAISESFSIILKSMQDIGKGDAYISATEELSEGFAMLGNEGMSFDRFFSGEYMQIALITEPQMALFRRFFDEIGAELGLFYHSTFSDLEAYAADIATAIVFEGVDPQVIFGDSVNTEWEKEVDRWVKRFESNIVTKFQDLKEQPLEGIDAEARSAAQVIIDTPSHYREYEMANASEYTKQWVAALEGDLDATKEVLDRVLSPPSDIEKKYLDSLESQKNKIAELGKTEEEILDIRRERALASASTEEETRAIREYYDALEITLEKEEELAKERATEANTQKYLDSTKSVKEAIDELGLSEQALLDLHRERALEGVTDEGEITAINKSFDAQQELLRGQSMQQYADSVKSAKEAIKELGLSEQALLDLRRERALEGVTDEGEITAINESFDAQQELLTKREDQQKATTLANMMEGYDDQLKKITESESEYIDTLRERAKAAAAANGASEDQLAIIDQIYDKQQEELKERDRAALMSSVDGFTSRNDNRTKEQKLEDEKKSLLANLEAGKHLFTEEEYQEAYDNILDGYNQMLQDIEDAEKPSWEDWTKEALNSFTQIAGEVDKLIQAITQSKVAALESQMQAELDAMGLVEKQERNKHTKSREEKAQNLVEIQKNLEKETDLQKRNELMQQENEEKEALDKLIKEEEDEEKRLAIQEKYEKEMAQVKYKAALFSWNVQKVQSIAGTAQAVINTMATTPFPLNLAMVPITMAIGALQLATLYANKPEPPAFALGALEIPQDMQATIHQGEMILPRPFAEDVRQGNIAIGETGGGVGGSHVKVEIYANDSVETEEVQDGDMTKLKVFVGKAWLDAYKKGQFDNPLMSRHGIKKRGIR